MKTISSLSFAPIIICIVLSGCTGYDRVLFATKTNVGLDIENSPPTFELSIARREIAIEPVLSNVHKQNTKTNAVTEADTTSEANSTTEDITLPLLASFSYRGFFDPQISANFAGGDAAIHLAKEIINEDGDSGNSAICLDGNPPDIRNLLRKAWDKIFGRTQEDSEKAPRPFFFATDTTFGLKVAWSGTGGTYPDTLRLGYNRKEFASPPVVTKKGCKGNSNKYEARVPSFFASINNKSKINVFEGSESSHTQIFATGRAATEFAKRPSVRQEAFEKMAPIAAEIENKKLNQKLYDEISKKLTANSSKLNDVIKQAIDLNLVPKDTDTSNKDDFLKLLSKNIKTSSSIVSTNLYLIASCKELN